ncbi:MAG: hypothetical protein ACP5VQ_01295 [Phycisphaerae bacterium]
MSAIRTRQEARERITKHFFDELDRVIPADESVPLKGQTFRDFELQARQIKESVIPTMLEERAALSESALQQQAGLCPHCGSDRTYLGTRVRKRELRSPDGVVVVTTQSARCRACNRSFSPSGS